MKKLNLPLVLDTAFSFICLSLGSFAVLNYFFNNLALSLTFSFAFGLVGALLCFLKISSSQSKKLVLAHDKKQTEMLSLHLFLASKESVSALFCKCFDGRPVKNKIESENSAYFPFFDLDGLERKDVARVIKQNCTLKKIILCISSSPKVNSLASAFEVKIMTIEDIYPLLKGKGLLPEKYDFAEVKNTPFLQKIKARFNKKLCPSLFLSGVGLLFLSSFTFYPFYYVIIGGILLFLSCLSLVFNA